MSICDTSWGTHARTQYRIIDEKPAFRRFLLFTKRWKMRLGRKFGVYILQTFWYALTQSRADFDNFMICNMFDFMILYRWYYEASSKQRNRPCSRTSLASPSGASSSWLCRQPPLGSSAASTYASPPEVCGLWVRNPGRGSIRFKALATNFGGLVLFCFETDLSK